MRGPAIRRERRVQGETQGFDAELSPVQGHQHRETGAWGAWDEHGLVGGDDWGWEEQEGVKDEIYPWVGEWDHSLDLTKEFHELEEKDGTQTRSGTSPHKENDTSWTYLQV